MAIEVVARRCGKLERLDVVGTQLNVGPHAVSTLLVSCTRLTGLHLARCRSDMSADAVVAAAANHPSGAGSRLTALTLCGLRRLTDAKLAESFGRFSALRSLSLESCTQITSTGLAALAAQCPQLAALRLKGCYRVKDPGVVAVVRGCTQLEKLDLQALAAITDQTVRALAEHHPTTLRSLNIWGCPMVRDEAVSAMLDSCTHLEKLVAKFSGIVSSATFEHLANTNRMRKLDIQGLVIEDVALDSIATYLSATLTLIDIRDCANLTARGMARMIASCTRLSVLRLRSASVDDSCVVAAARHLPRLHTLDLQKSGGVTALGVRALADSETSVCRRSLRILNVLGLPLLSRADVEAVLAALPMVKARTDYDVRPYEQG